MITLVFSDLGSLPLFTLGQCPSRGSRVEVMVKGSRGAMIPFGWRPFTRYSHGDDALRCMMTSVREFYYYPHGILLMGI
jgi:hypothetical protein